MNNGIARYVAMDEIDGEILKALRRDGRAPYTKIARDLGIPESTVRYKVKSMLDRGVIKGFTVEVSRDGLSCIVGIKADPKIDLEEACRKILEFDAVEFVFEVTGDYDCITLIREGSAVEINRTIDRIRVMRGIISTTSFLVLKEHT
jgi:DNA-binding Lrp family transcriptional regulator